MRFSHGLITACASAAIVAGGLQLPQALAQSSSGAFSILQQRWTNREGFKNLFYWVSETKPNRRSNYFLILRKNDRDKAIMKLDVMVPSYFDSKLKTKNIQLSYCQGGEGAMKRTICKETIPAAISLVNDGKTLEIFPESPVPPDKAIGVVFPVYNPGSGMYQFNALAQAPGDVPMAGYLGSWVIEITDGIDG